MYNIKTLSNGITIIHKEITSEAAYCGIVINTGTRDEDENQLGIAHFTEHLLFKGTKKRKSFQILNRIDNIGGEVDAFTSKEDTCVYVAFLYQYYERAVEFLNEIIFESNFPNEELIKEREVIISEIESYEDNPAEFIFDDFENRLFPDHSLGFNILGNKKQLKKYKSSDINNFVATKYNTDQMFFCSIGNIKFEKLIKYCEKYLGQNLLNVRNFKRINFNNKTKFNQIVNKKTHQSHCIIGNYAYSLYDSKRIYLMLLCHYLAGSGMNAKLISELREKRGLCYNIEANYTPFEDSGNFNIYFGVNKENTDYTTQIILKELNNLKTKQLGTLNLHKLKKQYISQLIFSVESISNMLYTIGKSFSIYGQIEDIKTSIKKIEQVNSNKLLEVANEIFDFDSFVTLIYK